MQRISGTRMVGLSVFCAAAGIVCAGTSVGYRSLPAVVVKTEPAVIQQKPQSPVLMAQTETPGQSIHGSVFDPANLPVPGAPITLTSIDSGASLTTATNNQGDYQLAGFPAGTYSVSVRVPGFKTLTQTGIRMGLGESRNAGKMMLQVGQVSEVVTITGSRSAPVPFIGTLGPMTTIPISAPPAPAPAVPAPFPTIGGKVSPVDLINQPRPAYPVELQRAGVAGTVKMQAVISKDGLVNDLTVNGSPDVGLARAAMEAVWKWRYRPATLNGEPIEVVTMIDVNYELRD